MIISLFLIVLFLVLASDKQPTLVQSSSLSDNQKSAVYLIPSPRFYWCSKRKKYWKK